MHEGEPGEEREGGSFSKPKRKRREGGRKGGREGGRQGEREGGREACRTCVGGGHSPEMRRGKLNACGMRARGGGQETGRP
jgi:ATP-dependent RNA helicase RhlE